MKKLIALLMLIGTVALHANAQDYQLPSLSYKVYPGTVTMLNGEILKGYIINSDNVNNQNQCVFYGDYQDARSRRTFKPADIAGYSIENNQYKSIVYSGNISFLKSSGKHFVYIAKPGAITTYLYWATDQSQQVLWQKGTEEPVSNATMLLSFKKTMLKLVADDTELAGKIDRKDTGYGMMGMVRIIDEYNAWTASKQQ
jgi:hypothetical protein